MGTDTRNHYETVVRDTVAEIQRRLDEPTGFRELADRAFLSPYHFHRIFRAMTGESPAEMLRRLRLERAAEQLRKSKLSVTEIAFDASYATLEAFIKAFQSEFQDSPTAFRSKGRTRCWISNPSGLHYAAGSFTHFHVIERGDSDMKLEVVDLPEMRLAAIRHHGAYQEIGAVFERLGRTAGELGLFGRPGAYTVGVFYDDPETVPEKDLRSLAAVIVDGDAPIGDLEEATIPGGRYFKGTYIGHYAGLHDAWQALYGKHVPESGHKFRDDFCFEIYVTTDHSAPDQLQTDLYIPIQ